MRLFSTTSSLVRFALFGVALAVCSLPASAYELLMIEQPICPYCKRFDVEVNYVESDTSKHLPLRRVQLNDPWPEDLAGIPYDMLTPTFVLVQDGKELGRLRGYPGREQFWELLNKLLEEKNIPLK